MLRASTGCFRSKERDSLPPPPLSRSCQRGPGRIHMTNFGHQGPRPLPPRILQGPFSPSGGVVHDISFLKVLLFFSARQLNQWKNARFFGVSFPSPSLGGDVIWGQEPSFEYTFRDRLVYFLPPAPPRRSLSVGQGPLTNCQKCVLLLWRTEGREAPLALLPS